MLNKIMMAFNFMFTRHKNASSDWLCKPPGRSKVLMLILLATSLHYSASSCSIESVKHSSDTPSTITLYWDMSDRCPSITKYKIQAKHLQYLSCKGKLANGNVSTYYVNQSFVILEELMPFSLYEIEIYEAIGWTRVSLEAETSEGLPQVSPVRIPGPSQNLSQAITFSWSPPSPSHCHLRRGTPSGYRVELWGVDPWVTDTKPLKWTNLNGTQFYAQHLLPFTNYILKVFALNSQFRFNPDFALEIHERTGSTVPKAPQEIKATLVNLNSIHLRWQPRYPPTGVVKSYVLRVGVLVEEESEAIKIIWRRRVEINGSRNYCNPSINPTINSHVCYTVENLLLDTTYHFQVQVINENVAEPSDFSDSTVVKTGTDSKDVSPDNGNSTQSWPIQSDPSSSVGGLSSTSKIVIIVISLTIIVVLVVVSTAYYYKIKMRKLEILYEQTRFNYSASNSFIGSNGYPQLVSFGSDSANVQRYFVGGPISPLRSSTRVPATMTTAHYIQSVATQIEEIQSRRLPEPPPSRHPGYLRPEVDPDEESSPTYVKIDIGQSLPIARYRNQEHSTQNDESEDVDGYLRPTFHRYSSESNVTFPSESSQTSCIDPIPLQSYVNPNSARVTSGPANQGYDQPRSSLTTQASVTSENHPLISH